MNTLLAQGAVFFQDSKNTVIFSSLVIFTLVLEEIFESVVFQCPCENHRLYGLLFLLGPSFILFVAGILLNPTTWWLCSISRLKRCRKKHDCPCENRGRRCRALVIISEIVCKALISPTIWLILSFLQKTFFVCTAFGPALKQEKVTKNDAFNRTSCRTLRPRSPSDEAELMAISQTIGLTLSVIVTFLVILRVFLAQCCGRKSKVCRLPDEKFYLRLEAIEAAKEFNKRAKQEAQKQGKRAVDELFSDITNSHRENYLTLISKAAQALDEKYSRYYNSSLLLTEECCKKSENQDNNRANRPRVHDVTFEEDLRTKLLLVVDGKNNSAEVKTETCTTIQSGGEVASATHTQSGVTRFCLRRAKSAEVKSRKD